MLQGGVDFCSLSLKAVKSDIGCHTEVASVRTRNVRFLSLRKPRVQRSSFGFPWVGRFGGEVWVLFVSGGVDSRALSSRLVLPSLRKGYPRNKVTGTGKETNFQFQLQVGAVLGKYICVESSDGIVEKQISSLRQLLGQQLRDRQRSSVRVEEAYG